MVYDGSAKGIGSPSYICPGFCGRINSSAGDGTYSTCQACSWGSRSINRRFCVPCRDPLPVYDWLFLLFVAIVPLLLHSLFVHVYTPKYCSRRLQLAHYVCCFAECVLSSILSLLVIPPRGSLALEGCQKFSLLEWYPVFFNPIINHTYTMRCAHEIVFPLYSLPFVYLTFCLLSLLILRSCLYATVFRRSAINSKPFYAALHSLPLLALMHFFLAGILYYTFPFLTLVISLIINATHMAVVRGRRVGTVCKKAFLRLKNVMILLIHMTLFGFSLFALMLNFPYGKPFLVVPILCIPLPFLYYCFIAGLSHPKFVHCFP